MIALDLDKGWVFDRPEWRKRLAELALATNRALAANDHEAARKTRDELFQGLESLRQQFPAAAEISIKASRNELVRLYMIHGWYAEAEEVARAAVSGLKVDRFCPNREPIVRETLARVLLVAGKLEEADLELSRAEALTRTNLQRVHEAWLKYPNEASWPRPMMQGPSRPVMGGPVLSRPSGPPPQRSAVKQEEGPSPPPLLLSPEGAPQPR